VQLSRMASVAALFAGVICALSGCSTPTSTTTASDDRSSTSPASDEQVQSPPTPTPKPTPEPTEASATSTGQLPQVVGKGLQYAQDTAQAAGFYSLTSHDSSGRGRLQVLDRAWKVCFQTPSPGAANTSDIVDFGVVKLDETCPTNDVTPAAAAADAPDTMPSVVGKSVRVAEDLLGSNASITIHDATGQERAVLLTSNWQVCDQHPAAGEPFAGIPVDLQAVKYGERC
jgi:hypothetical protein